MKKKYTTPVLMMESFTLSQSIAHNCGQNLVFDNATLKYKSTCGWDVDGDKTSTGDIVFMDDNICTYLTESVDGLVCYNNPEGGYNIFNS